MRTFFTPWLVLPLALVVMAGVMFGAIVADSIRLRDAELAQVEAIRAAQAPLEKRYFELARRHPARAQEHAVPVAGDFRSVIERFRVDLAANPTPASIEEKRLRDDLAGVINRWEVIDRELARATTNFDAYAQSFRGRLAQRYSPQ